MGDVLEGIDVEICFEFLVDYGKYVVIELSCYFVRIVVGVY